MRPSGAEPGAARRLPGYLLGLGAGCLFLAWRRTAGSDGLWLNLALAAIVLLAALLERWAPRRARVWSARLRLPWLILFSLGFSFLLFGMNLRAEFGIIDDHEILEYVGPDGELHLGEMPAVLLATELGRPGEFPRYRPARTLLRVGETWLWGLNPTAWYVARWLGVAAFMALLAVALARYLSGLETTLLLIYLFSFPYWGDIFSRLGPGEAYAAVGTGLFALGFVWAWEALRGVGRRLAAGWWLMGAGLFLAIGSKENFVILLPFCFWLLALAWRRARGRGLALGVTTFGLGYAGIIAWAVIRANATLGITIRGDELGVGTLWREAVGALAEPPGLALVLVALALAAVWVPAALAPRGRPLRRPTAWALIGVLGGLGLYVSQVVFYSGRWPTGGRYDFPGLFYEPILFFTLGWYLWRLCRLWGRAPGICRGWRLGLALGLALAVSLPGIEALRAVGKRNVAYTQAVSARLEGITVVVSPRPEAAIVFESHRPLDFEAAISWARFLRARGVENPVYLRLQGYGPETEEGLNQVLAGLLAEASREGERGFRPLAELAAYGDRCFSFQMSGETATGCEPLP